MNNLNDWDDLLSTDEQVEVFTILYESIEAQKKQEEKRKEVNKYESNII